MMKFRWLLVVSLLSVAVMSTAIWPAGVRADDGALGAVGSAVQPMQNTQVIMASERVEATILGGQAWVTCVFTFTNSGPATSVLMGFPQLQAGDLGGSSDLLDFQALADGLSVPVTFRLQAEAGPDTVDYEKYKGWYTFEVAFAAGQTRVVRNIYHGSLNFTSNGDLGFSYILSTGASWQGPIGVADIVVRWARDRDVYQESLRAYPAGYETGDRQVKWHFTNIEPGDEDNISVNFRPVYGTGTTAWFDTASASSGLEIAPEKPLQPAPFADGKIETAWHSVGEAEKSWISWGTQSPWNNIPTLGIGILPGVANDSAEFKAHGRPKEVLIRLAHLKPGADWQGEGLSIFHQPAENVDASEYHLTLDDSATWQFLRLPEPAIIDHLEIIVVSVYPGEKYNDVAITEVLYPVLAQDLQGGPILLPTTGVSRMGSPVAVWFALGLGLALIAAGSALRFGRREFAALIVAGQLNKVGLRRLLSAHAGGLCNCSPRL